MSASLTLYELAAEDNALQALIGMDDGELTPEAEALEMELVAAMASKADKFGAVVQAFDDADETIERTITRLKARQKAFRNKSERLRRYGLMALNAMQRTRVEGALHTLTVQNNPPRVEVSVPVEALPEAYVRVVPESREVNKAAISAALKAGATIEGCALITSQSLRIR